MRGIIDSLTTSAWRLGLFFLQYTIFNTQYQTHYTKHDKNTRVRFPEKAGVSHVRLSNNGATYYISSRLLMKFFIHYWIKTAHA